MNEGVSIHSLPRAEALAKQVREYWSAKGHTVKVWIVRTDLVNGLPRK